MDLQANITGRKNLIYTHQQKNRGIKDYMLSPNEQRGPYQIDEREVMTGDSFDPFQTDAFKNQSYQQPSSSAG